MVPMQPGGDIHRDESGPSDAPKRGPRPLFHNESTRLLLYQLAEIESTFRSHGREIWGFDFDPMSIPTLYVHRAGERFFGVCCGPIDINRLLTIEGAEAAPTPALPALRRRDDPDSAHPYWKVNHAIVAAFQPPPGRDVSFDPGLAAVEGLVIDFSSPNYHPDSWEFARFVVHEAFHYYQTFQAKWPVPRGYDPATPPTTSPDHSELAKHEARMIEIASLSSVDEEAMRFVREFVELRQTRYRRWPRIEMLERGTEQIEGSARYVENQYSRCNGRSSRLNLPPESLRPDRDWIDFGRLYRSGARMLELLDRFGIMWRKRLANGEDPYGILLTTLATATPTDPTGSR